MDELAKAHIMYGKQCPCHNIISSEPWSIWVGEKKISRNFSDMIYEIAHADQAKQYWLTKEGITPESSHSVNWDAVDVTIKDSPMSRRTFVAFSRNVWGCMFMVRWKEWEKPGCPRCGVLRMLTMYGYALGITPMK